MRTARRTILAMLAVMLLGLLGMAMTPEARQSYEAFERRAESGDAEAQYRLSALLERGYDTIAADTARSLGLLRRSAHSGYAPARNYLGYLYRNGAMGLSANLDSAMYWIGLAADSGYAPAYYNLAYVRAERGDSLDAATLRHLQEAVEAGLPQAMVLMADLKVAGNSVERDSAGAVTLYEDAIARGLTDAQLNLLNLTGPGFKDYDAARSLAEARRYMRLGAPTVAAELLLNIGDGTAQTAEAYALLGHLHSRGLGVEYNHAKANEYFARSAAMGYAPAMFVIAETLDIFPDAFAGTDISLPPPDELRQAAAEHGIKSAEDAVKAMWQ